jgi:aminoglycoside 3-N-acetyltransferase
MTNSNKQNLGRTMIKDGLIQLGVEPGDTLFVHSSLSSLGEVNGGAGTVIDALLDVIGDKGNLVLPTFTFSFSDGRSTPYHPKRTASRVGHITEYFRFKKGVMRSMHPTHSVAAYGSQAAEIISEHQPTDSPCGKNSPFAKLLELRAKVIFLGGCLMSNTTLHAVEDWVNLPYIIKRSGEALIFDDEENIKKISFPKEPGGHRSFFINRSKIEKAFDKEGIIAETQIGNSYTQMIPIRNIIQVTLEYLSKEPDILLCDNPVCEFCVSEKNEILAQKDIILRTIADLKQELW